jgi:hypothetical protein
MVGLLTATALIILALAIYAGVVIYIHKTFKT